MKQEVSIKKLRKLFEQNWDANTCLCFGEFDPQQPSFGQCYVTAICIQDIMGGEIIEGDVNGLHHFWNEFPDGSEWDLTSDQFEGGDGIHPHNKRIKWGKRHSVNRKNRRYLLLKNRITKT